MANMDHLSICSFFIHISMDVCDQSRSAGQPSSQLDGWMTILRGKKLMLDITRKLLNQIAFYLALR